MKKDIAWALVGICIFFLSLFIAPYYVLSDQAKYTSAYNGISDLNLVEGYAFYVNETGGKEFLYYLIVWLTSGWGIEKNVVMAFSNALLAIFTMRLFAKWQVSMFVAATIVLSNFYMMVLYFAAERLKFAVLFLVISLLFEPTSKRFYAVAMMAVTSHFQMALIYASMLFCRTSNAVIRFLKDFRFSIKRVILPLLLLASLAFIADSILTEYVIPKVAKYSQDASDKGIADLMRIVLLLMLSLWYSKNKKETILIFIPLMVAVLIVGADRINIFGYFAFLYYGLRYRGGVNLGVLVTTVYFAWKSYYFVADIIEYGYGYAS